MKEKNNNNKKKIILVLIAVLTILLVIGGATYAFYTVQVNNSSTQTNINTNTEVVGNATLRMLTDSLHINVTAQDMAEGNKGNDYYGTKDATKGYEREQEKATYNLVEVEMKDGGSTTKYVCSATIKVSVEGEMVSGLKAKDLILSLNGGNLEEELDIYSIKETKEKSYDVNFNIEGNTTHTIKGYLKLSNRDEDQKDLANKSLNVKLNSTKIECNVVTEFPKEEPKILKQLRENDTSSFITNEEVGGLYRYQGTDNVNNWICFGTSSNCSTTDELIDKYMYRIIGVTPEGQLKLIKETYVKEETTGPIYQNSPGNQYEVIQGKDGKYYLVSIAWNNNSSPTSSYCEIDGSNCTWEKSRIYNRINGLCNSSNTTGCIGTTKKYGGDSNFFIGNSYYEYLINNSPWLNKIEDYEWKYGDMEYSIGDTYNGDTVYATENGWTDKITSKIGLQYLHDYLYAYPSGNPGTKDNAITSWIFFQKDGYNVVNDNSDSEHLITRWSPEGIIVAWVIYSSGSTTNYPLNYYTRPLIRPVFYLKNSIKIIEGNGSKDSPYIIQQ